MKKILERVLGPINYIEHGEVPVEVLHLLDVSVETNVVGDRTITNNYLKFPSTINRPASGKTIVEIRCNICGAPLKVPVRSKEYLIKIIKKVFIIFIVSSFLPILLLKLPRLELGFNIFGFDPIISGLVLFAFLSSVALFLLLSDEYMSMGISNQAKEKQININGRYHRKHIIAPK